MNDKFNNAVGPQVRAPRAKAGKTIPVLAVCHSSGLAVRHAILRTDFQYQSRWAPLQHLYVPWSILHWASKWYGSIRARSCAPGTSG